MSIFRAVVFRISWVLGLVATGVILPMCLLVVAHVVGRYFFSSPITGAAEISITIMLFLPLAMCWAAWKNQHIRIEEVLKRLPKRVASIIEIVMMILGTGIASMIAWRLFDSFLYEFKRGSGLVSLMLPIPTWPLWFITFLSWASLTLILVYLVCELINEARKIWLRN